MPSLVSWKQLESKQEAAWFLKLASFHVFKLLCTLCFSVSCLFPRPLRRSPPEPALRNHVFWDRFCEFRICSVFAVTWGSPALSLGGGMDFQVLGGAALEPTGMRT